ncbi:MAG: heavy metal translocating P-type ATPase [Pseudomonadota bacterium]
MSCCSTRVPPETARASAAAARDAEFDLSAETPRPGVRRLHLAAPSMHCGACVATIERRLGAQSGVLAARANLTAKTVTVEWSDSAQTAGEIAAEIEALGFPVYAVDDAKAESAEAAAATDLLRRMAVAGFAAANVMLLSVSIWAGAEGSTRDLLHWISALIALPTIAYSGRPFFVSALGALKGWRLNMDVPISLAIVLAAIVSLYEVSQGGHEAYFDAAVSLIFLLLIGRWLDSLMRGNARSAARTLARMTPRGAWVLPPNGERRFVPVDEIEAGDVVQLAPGDRMPVDGTVLSGTSALDRSLLTGESEPVAVASGGIVEAGALNLDGGLTVRATSTAEASTLADIAKLVTAAEERKSRLARLADRAAQIYAPVIHLVALAVLLGWLATGADLREAILAAIATLIVTCPCALGLAAPMAQAVASGALFGRGIMLKDGAALERLALVKAAAFDKTGVLTLGTPRVIEAPALEDQDRAMVAALAGQSRHPMAQAVDQWARHQRKATPMPTLDDTRESPGEGIEAMALKTPVRLGSARFCGVERTDGASALSEVWFRLGEAQAIRFGLEDTLRPEAAETVGALHNAGIATIILSGDRAPVVKALGETLGTDAEAELRPEDKLARLERMRKTRTPVLMVGDGLNDAPALAAADVSIAPANASDVGRAAADIVFTGRSLGAVRTVWHVAQQTRAVILQNFGLAALYNMIAIPAAAAGLVGPLEAAIAMSTSSLLVTANALRIRLVLPAEPQVAVGAAAAERGTKGGRETAQQGALA